MDYIKQNEKYKLLKKLEKEEKKIREKIEKRKVYLEALKQKVIENKRHAINTKYNKKILKFEKKEQEKLRKVTMNIKRIETNRKAYEYKADPNEGVDTIKELAFKAFQLYSRIKEAKEDGYVICLDNLEYRHRSGCQGGHYFGKHNNPHLAFYEDNCRPITGMANKMQFDKEGVFWKANLILKIKKKRFEKMEKIQKDQGLKNRLEIKTKKYYEERYFEFAEKCAVIVRRHGRDVSDKRLWNVLGKYYNSLESNKPNG